MRVGVESPTTRRSVPRGYQILSGCWARLRVSAGGRLGGSWPVGAGACGSAGRVAAARCEGGSRNCCNDRVRCLRREASGRAQDILGSNTALSNPEDIASSFCLARTRPRWRKGTTAPPKLPGTKQIFVRQAGLCAEGSSESRKIYTISSGGVAGRLKGALGVACGLGRFRKGPRRAPHLVVALGVHGSRVRGPGEGVDESWTPRPAGCSGHGMPCPYGR
jgi:hypothetical protein